MRSFLTMNLLGTLPAMGALGNDSLRNWRDSRSRNFYFDMCVHRWPAPL